MYHYELYKDSGAGAFVVSDKPIDDFPGKVQAVMRAMPVSRLTGKADWFTNVVDEVCKVLKVERVRPASAINIEDEITDITNYERR